MELGPSLDQCARAVPGTVFPKNADQLFSRENMLIRPSLELDTRETVITIGSCFARNIEESMRSVGFDVPMLSFAVPKAEWDGARPNGILNRYTPFSIRQLLDWVVGALEDPDRGAASTESFWLETGPDRGIDLDLGGLVPVSHGRFLERRAQLLEAFAAVRTAELVVITLGQTESWVYEPLGMHWSGAPATASLRALWPQTRLVTADADTAAEEIRQSIATVRRINPSVRILLTVSPVPASRYWSGTPAVSAYWQSKIRLWDAAQRLVEELDAVHYFPSFEAVHLAPQPWTEDRLHVTDDTVRRVVEGMLRANSHAEIAVPRAGEAGYVSMVSTPTPSLVARVKSKVGRLRSSDS